MALKERHRVWRSAARFHRHMHRGISPHYLQMRTFRYDQSSLSHPLSDGVPTVENLHGYQHGMTRPIASNYMSTCLRRGGVV